MQSNQVKKLFFPPEYEKVFNQYIINWCISIFCIGSIVALFSIPIDDVWFFDMLAKITPGIEKWTEATQHRDVAKAVWLYMTYSIFLILPRMIYLIKKVNINNAFAFFIIILPLLYFFAVFFINGSILDHEINHTSDANKRMLLYKKNEFMCIFISTIIGAAFLTFLLKLLLAIIKILNIRNILERR